MATYLNDTQLVLLTTASQRDAGNLLPLPMALNDGGNRVTKAVYNLLKCGLISEAPTTVDVQAWREDEDGRIGLIISDAGRIAIGVDPLANVDEAGPGSTSEAAFSTPSMASETPLNASPQFRAGTKQALVVEMVSAEFGASLNALVAATGWQPHTTRAAITGLRKRGHIVLTEKRNGICCYRIAADVGA